VTKSKQAIRVLMADDHMIFRQSVRKLLEGEDDISIVGEAANGNECIAMMAQLKPDILLLDINMPDKDGLAVLQEINFDSLPTQVIVLTAAEDDRDAVQVMRRGARGIVLKQSASDLLVKSIHRVYGGEIWLDNRITAEVMKAFTKDSTGWVAARQATTQRPRKAGRATCRSGQSQQGNWHKPLHQRTDRQESPT
jgi:DNA-binding NarL/FixJ family response regulator